MTVIELRTKYTKMLEHNKIKVNYFYEHIFFTFKGKHYMRAFDLECKRQRSLKMFLSYLSHAINFRKVEVISDLIDDRTTIGLNCLPEFIDKERKGGVKSMFNTDMKS